MRMKWFYLLWILALAALALSACAGPNADADPAVKTVEDCPAPAENMQQFINEEHGYCLLYPEGYDVDMPNENEAVIFVGSLLDVEHPKAYIKIEDAAGRTAEQAADELVADLEGFEIDRSSGLAIGGESNAVLLDNLPGQDINRQVLMVHGDRLYRLMFVPADKNLGEIYNQMESLYSTITESFTFIEQK